MADAITWRNINAPDFRDALLASRFAGESINSGFDSLQKALTGQQQANQNALDQQHLGALADFKTKLANAQTPEELAALREQGATLQAGMSAQQRVDTANDFNNRQGAIQKQTLDNWKFEDDTQKRLYQGTTNQVLKLGYAGKTAEANALLDSLPPDLRDYATTAAAVSKAGLDINKDTRETNKTNSEINYQNAQITHLGNQDRVSEAELKLKQAAAEKEKTPRAPTPESLAGVSKLSDHAAELSAKVADRGGFVIGTKGAAKTLQDFVNTQFPDPGMRARVSQDIQSVLSDKKYQEVPVDSVISALTQTTSKWAINPRRFLLPYGAGGANTDFASNLDSYMKTDNYKSDVANVATKQKALSNQAAAANVMRDVGFVGAGLPVLAGQPNDPNAKGTVKTRSDASTAITGGRSGPTGIGSVNQDGLTPAEQAQAEASVAKIKEQTAGIVDPTAPTTPAVPNNNPVQTPDTVQAAINRRLPNSNATGADRLKLEAEAAQRNISDLPKQIADIDAQKQRLQPLLRNPPEGITTQDVVKQMADLETQKTTLKNQLFQERRNQAIIRSRQESFEQDQANQLAKKAEAERAANAKAALDKIRSGR